MPVPEELFATLRRHPDVEAPNLYAVDGADRLVLDEAAAALTVAGPGQVTVIGDHYGALTLGAVAGFGASDVRVHQDPLTGERALSGNAERAALAGTYRQCPLGESLLSGATVVLVQLPRSLAALTEIAETVARYADPSVVVYAGGRDKYLTHAFNDVLATCFADVHATRGRQKSRVLVAAKPTPVPPSFPHREHLAELDLDVVAHGAAFAGATLDIGTRYLLDFLPRTDPGARTAVDLGCGTGILAVSLARLRPDVEVIATDQSAAAVASASATAAANGVADRVAVLRDDAMSGLASDSVDLIVCNPPFHVGAAVHTGAAESMFRAAGRVLRPGGELWTVYNSHLGYRADLRATVGDTEQVGRNPKFTVTRSIARG